jgi:hypothetical protein
MSLDKVLSKGTARILSGPQCGEDLPAGSVTGTINLALSLEKMHRYVIAAIDGLTVQLPILRTLY